MGFFTGCARVLLFIFNFIFWLSGAGILGVGIWILVDPNVDNYITIINTSAAQDPFFKNAAYILIAFGAFVFLVGFCGCCGAIRNSKCLLGFYIFFLVLVFAGELAAGIVVAVFKGDLEKKLTDQIQNSIKMDYNFGNVSSFGKAIDTAQYELKCCGGILPTDYMNSKWTNDTGLKLPMSCCVMKTTTKAYSQVTSGDVVNLSACQTMTSDYHMKGCKDQLLQWLQKHAVILIGVGCGIAGLQIFGLIFAICVCRNVDKAEKY